ncbi:stathmin domain-containing protein 1 [Hyla sarda]|uniref:stathmin domain-containing protein 1 n=1 Tax=Hyla sarda TaxID=327740 RepID=UPI0024C38788|nr:stathmin domain-containing protein 1 [Hyla sarda]
MGCQSSKVQVVKPTGRRRSGWAEDGKAQTKDELTLQKDITSNARDGSALSKGTLDSGVGLEDGGAGSHIPGTVSEIVFSPRRANALNKDISLLNREAVTRERQASSDILEELMSQGIIQSESKVVKNGEAYDVMVDTPGKSIRRPPAKLEKLKTIKKKNNSLTKEDIEAKMKAAEERRKTKEEELKKRLRDRPMTALPSISQFRREGSLTPDDGQEAEATKPTETLDSYALENGISGTTQSPGAGDNDADINVVESDNTYNNPPDQTNDFENDF